MASKNKKSGKLVVRLMSPEGTGCSYMTTRNPKTMPEKLKLRKYDWVKRKHLIFKEIKASN